MSSRRWYTHTMSHENSTNVTQTTVDILLQTTALAHSLPAKVAVGLAASAVMAIIIVGNTLVCVAVITERKLRHPQNWFLVSLAASDLLVGTLIMPFSLAYELMGYWAFGPVWCEIWLAMDVFACTASIFHLCLIALERYRCVTNPTAYSSPTINRRQGILIAGAYVIAAAISLPPLFGWAEPHEQDAALPTCPLRQSLGYVVFSATASFYIPLIIMVIAYICLIIATRAQLRKKLKNCPPVLSTPLPSQTKTPKLTPKPTKKKDNCRLMNKTGNHPTPPRRVETIHLQVMTVTRSRRSSTDLSQATPSSSRRTTENTTLQGYKTTAITAATTPDDEGLGKSDCSECLQDCTEISKENGNVPVQQFPARCAIEVEDSSQQPEVLEMRNSCIKACQLVTTKLELQFDKSRKEEFPSSPAQEKMKMLQSKERRFTLIIGLVIGAFIVCWYPFFQLYPIVVACTSCNVPDVVFKVFFWIGYCNSALNPIIYTVFNKDFRVAFLKIITCGFRNRKSHTIKQRARN